MTARSDEDLLHAWLDGTLGEEEVVHLRGRIAADPALRTRAGELERLARLVTSLEPSDPPAAFADKVMDLVSGLRVEPAPWRRRVRARLDQTLGRVPRHLQQETRSGAVVRWNTGLTGGGDIVAKKALWAVAGLAVVIILGVVYFNGTRTVDQGAQGTIGGAERYRGAQPASVAVKEGDAQKFLQSDTFDRLIKDKDVRNLLSNHVLRAELVSVELAALLEDKDAAATLTNAEVEAQLMNRQNLKALQDEASLAIIRDAALTRGLLEPEVAAAVANEKTRKLILDSALQAEMKKKVAMQRELSEYADAALKGGMKFRVGAYPELDAAVKADQTGAMKALLEDQAFLRALTKGGALLFADMRVTRAMQSELFMELFSGDRAFLRAMQSNAELKRLVDSALFQAYMKRARSAELFAELGTFKALADAELSGMIASRNANLGRALQDGVALDAALANRR